MQQGPGLTPSSTGELPELLDWLAPMVDWCQNSQADLEPWKMAAEDIHINVQTNTCKQEMQADHVIYIKGDPPS